MNDLAYHFVSDKLRDGRPIPADGEWLEHNGPLIMCESGLNASIHPFDALQCAPGNTLCLVEIIHGDDKVIATRRRIVKRIDAEPMLREFGRWCALQVIDLWDAPEVVRQYLTTGDESLGATAWAAARSAAWAAAGSAAGAAAWDAWAAAGSAAWAAAGSAAGSAAWAAEMAAAQAANAATNAATNAAQRERFAKMVEGAMA